MGDSNFVALLRDVVSIRRPRVELSRAGNPRTPVYEWVTEDVPCALQPVSEGLRASLIGAFAEATHVAYLEPTDVRAGDLVIEHMASDALKEAAVGGARTLRLASGGRFAPGDRLEIGTGNGSEIVTVESVAGKTVQLTGPLALAHSAGSAVRVALLYEVLGALDEAGLGHHLRLSLRRVVV